MPFDFKKYDAKCNAMDVDQLHLEWQHYTRLIAGASTSTAVSGLAVPFTFGVSTIGVAVAAPAIHNARKKREIIEKHLQKLGTTHDTRKRDVLGPMAVSSTIGVVTLGVGAVGADVIGQAGVEHGVNMIVENELAVKATTHLALDAAVVGAEHHHAENKKAEEAYKHIKPTGYCKPQEAGYGQEKNYGDQIQPPAAYGSSDNQAQVQGNALGPPPAYTPNNFNLTSTNLPLDGKSQIFMHQTQYQHPDCLQPQQANVVPYISQPSNQAQPQYVLVAQEFKPPTSPAPTYTSSSSYMSWDNKPVDLGQQTSWISSSYKGQQPHQYAAQPQYVHGQYLPQPPQPIPQNTQQYQQQYPQQNNPPQNPQIQYNPTSPMVPPTHQLNPSQLCQQQQQQFPYFPPPPNTPWTPSQSHEKIQPPPGHYTPPSLLTGQYLPPPPPPQTQMNFGYPTPALTPYQPVDAEKSYFNQAHHG
ncbi:hypothetical protein FKW77_007498 [Venturia effusa]|uniref:Uncharacterized protein n=1 Tax=Venturia effusa TaxID=50376 RepID=A0A517LB67_9PEZI|nr:hypothetical protein FKW77_007498 [Venturia effusa]